MHLLTTLLLAHLFADFPLQTNRLAKLKTKSITGVFIHVMIYMAVTALLLQDPLRYWPLIVGLAAIHFVIDAGKIYCQLKSEITCFVIDQCLHVLTVSIAAYIAHQVWSPVPTGILPNTLLMVAFLCALTLAVMVFCWIWTKGLSDEQVNQYGILRWARERMLPLEQQLGFLLLILVFIGHLMI